MSSFDSTHVHILTSTVIQCQLISKHSSHESLQCIIAYTLKIHNIYDNFIVKKTAAVEFAWKASCFPITLFHIRTVHIRIYVTQRKQCTLINKCQFLLIIKMFRLNGKCSMRSNCLARGETILENFPLISSCKHEARKRKSKKWKFSIHVYVQHTT